MLGIESIAPEGKTEMIGYWYRVRCKLRNSARSTSRAFTLHPSPFTHSPFTHSPSTFSTMTIGVKTLTRNWNYPTSVRFGPGRIGELPAVCEELSMKRPLLVTDPGLRKLGLGDAVFSDIRSNPVGKNVDDGVAFYKARKCDGIIALGGGSALDVGKTIALMVGQTRPVWDFEDRDDWYTRVNVAGVA